jgi:hypothetical protein
MKWNKVFLHLIALSCIFTILTRLNGVVNIGLSIVLVLLYNLIPAGLLFCKTKIKQNISLHYYMVFGALFATSVFNIIFWGGCLIVTIQQGALYESSMVLPFGFFLVVKASFWGAVIGAIYYLVRKHLILKT